MYYRMDMLLISCGGLHFIIANPTGVLAVILSMTSKITLVKMTLMILLRFVSND